MSARVEVSRADSYVTLTWEDSEGRKNSVIASGSVTLRLGDEGVVTSHPPHGEKEPNSHENGHPSAQKISPDATGAAIVTLNARAPGGSWLAYARSARATNYADLETKTLSIRRVATRLREEHPDWDIKIVTEEIR